MVQYRPQQASRDAGYTLGEILVAMVLFVMVATITGTLIVEANKATRKTTSSAFAQSQMLDVVARISREVVVANPILVAQKSELETVTIRDKNCVQTLFWAAPATKDIRSRTYVASTGTNSCPPNLTSLTGNTLGAEKVVAGNIDPVNGLKLTYYDNSDSLVPVDSAGTVASADLKAIGRVAIALAAGPVTGRSAPLTLQTSMATRLGTPSAGYAGVGRVAATCPDVTATTAVSGVDVTLTWAPMGGVTSYLITRTADWASPNPRQGGVTQTGTTLTDPGLPLGGSYSYVVAPVGVDCSASPTVVTLAPGKPALTGSVTVGTYDATLTWSPVLGATGYILQRDGVTIQTFGAAFPASVTDPGLTPSTTYTYSVIATNATGNTYSNDYPLTVPFTGASDTFTKPDGGPLGVTETGGLPWLFPTGSVFTTTGGTATTATPSGSNPMAVVEPGTPNVDAKITTTTGGEAIYTRVQDGTNWLRARAVVTQTTTPVYGTQHYYQQYVYTSNSYYTTYTYYTVSNWIFDSIWSCDNAYANISAAHPTSPGQVYWEWNNFVPIMSSTETGALNRIYEIEYTWPTTSSATCKADMEYYYHYAFGNFHRNVTTTTGWSGPFYYYTWNPTGTYYWAFTPAGGADADTGTTLQVQTGTTIVTNYGVVLEKSVNGTVSTLATYPNVPLGSLRVVTKGDQISTYANGSATPLGTVTEPAFQNATQVGFGLGGPTLAPAATSVDNFTLLPAP